MPSPVRFRFRFPALPAVAALAAAFVPALAHQAFAQETPATPPSPSAAAPVSAPPADVSAVITQVQSFYDQSSSFVADFTQEYLIKQYAQKKLSHGHVVFKKPGKMFWRYDDPQGNRVVSDGQKLKVYEQANKQMYEQDVSASQYPAALSFLTGQGKLTDTFDFQLFDGEKMSFPGGWVLLGTPKTPTPAYQKVFFYVDKQTKQVRRVLILDGQGNHNRFDFDNPLVNTKVDDATFVFTPPAGTSIIHP
jgi:outer membrane lipoprotein carrier protein